MELEHKFSRLGGAVRQGAGAVIEGYASLFGEPDQGGDIVVRGAYGRALAVARQEGRRIRMLWQHDPSQPIGVWDEVREDERGLFVRGRVLKEVARGREAAALLEAGAIDGLSIGYRTRKAGRDEKGRRLLQELELWEVSLVTFPMLPGARVGRKEEASDALALKELAEAIEAARRELRRDGGNGRRAGRAGMA